jgi:hypothetical protein
VEGPILNPPAPTTHQHRLETGWTDCWAPMAKIRASFLSVASQNLLFMKIRFRR